MLGEHPRRVLENYLAATGEDFAGHTLAQVMRRDIPQGLASVTLGLGPR